MEVAELRRVIGLTQTAFARLLGVTQPAVAAWEKGIRRPTGEAANALVRLQESLHGPVRRYAAYRGRSVELPAHRWAQPIELSAEVELPLRLDWSPRAAPRRLDDRNQRAGLYAQVIDEGTPADMRIWIDPDDLAELWPDVPVARHLRKPVNHLVASLKAP